MAHTVRFDIYDVLRTANEPLTTSQMRQRMPTLPSHLKTHLARMAEVGVVVREEGDTWRIGDGELRFPGSPEGDDDLAFVLRDLARIVGKRRTRHMRAWRRATRQPEWQAWAEDSIGIDTTVCVTHEQLGELERRMMATLNQFRADIHDIDPGDESEVVHLIIEAFPLRAALAADEDD